MLSLALALPWLLAPIAPQAADARKAPQKRAGPEVRFELRDLSGQQVPELPVTLSALLAPGLFHDDDVTAVVRDGPDGGPAVVPAQVNVLSHHGDGSVQHALVSMRIDLKPHATREVYLVPSPALAPPKPERFTLFDPKRAAAVVELVAKGGARYTALLVPTSEEMEVEKPESARDRRLWGPIVRELERSAPLRAKEGEHPTLRVTARWRFFAGEPLARVDVVLENDPPPGRGKDAPPPDDVEFDRLAIVAGERTLCDLKEGILFDRTRCILRGFVGAEPPRVLVREDLAYLERNDWIPPYDPRAPLSDSLANELAHKIVDSEMNGDVNPAAFPAGIPLDAGPITHYMPMTGGRNDIGVLPSWAVVALQSRSAYAEDVLTAADMNGAGSFPIHVRQADGTMGVEFAAGKELEARKNRIKCPRVPDRAHAPLLGYVTFLLTGDVFAEEELASEAAYCFYDWPHDGRYRYPGSRDFAWSLRTTMLAAQLLPDGNPLKPYLRERVLENLKELRKVVESDCPLHSWGAGSWESSGRKSSPCTCEWSAWQASWADASLWWTARVLKNGDARAMFEWLARYYTLAYSSVGQQWNAPDGTTVTWPNGHLALSYSFPVATYQPEIVNGEWRPRDGTRRFIKTFPEAAWWLRVSLDHEFAPGKLPSLPTGPDGVPTLPAEEWRPSGAYTPPPLPATSWVEYAMHWLAVVLEADGIEGGHAVYAAVRPCIDQQVPIPGLRMWPEMLKR